MLLNERSGPPHGRTAAELYVSSAAATIFGPSKKGLWAMLSVYLDDSGTHLGSSVCVVSGLIASPEKWERLTSSWVKVLEDVGIPDFHASDCAVGGGIFDGWEKSRRESLYIRMVNLTKKFPAYRTWTAVAMDDYRDLYERDDKKEEFPFSLCAIGCASWVRQLARDRNLNASYVFDQGEKGDALVEAFRDLIRQGRADFYRLGMLSQGERVKCPPLQAADLMAYETYKYFADQLDSNRSARRSFLELLRIPDLGGNFLNGERLQAVAAAVRDTVAGKEPAYSLLRDPLDREQRIKVGRRLK